MEKVKEVLDLKADGFCLGEIIYLKYLRFPDVYNLIEDDDIPIELKRYIHKTMFTEKIAVLDLLSIPNAEEIKEIIRLAKRKKHSLYTEFDFTVDSYDKIKSINYCKKVVNHFKSFGFEIIGDYDEDLDVSVAMIYPVLNK